MRTDNSNKKFHYWCVGIIIDVSDGTENLKWKKLTSTNKCYGKGESAEIHRDAVMGHEESDTVEALKSRLFNRHIIGGWRFYYE